MDPVRARGQLVYNLAMRIQMRAVPAVVITLAVCALAAVVVAHAQQRAAAAPRYRVDPFWPKPLPNKWSMQQIVDIYVDKRRSHLGNQPPGRRAPRRVDRGDQPAARRVLRARARDPGIRPGRQRRELVGRSGLSPRLARATADNCRRSSKERLAVRDDARRQHHRVLPGRQVPEGLRPSRSQGAGRPGEAGQPADGDLPARHWLVRAR